ncbi:XRE family transcriptional regulator [Desulfosporosinus fructosivorans]|uniref:XRE family transcriptional regulator n=1 Tax=Desulfosporosinus fructosivorans TaxID=2018669 RepID=A0A4Z0RDU6_9FIRM|nr:XRE family transcriptional regulator [Desulfosporosinus fructosivorans]
MPCGYTLEQVAKHCGVSPETIRKYELNSSRLPLYLIIKLSELYNIQPNSLVSFS